MDAWGWEQLRPARPGLNSPSGPRFCHRRPDPRAVLLVRQRAGRVPPARRPSGHPAPLRAAPAAPRPRRRARTRGRPAQRHPAPTRPRQPRYNLDLLAGHRHRRDHRPVHAGRAPDVRPRRSPVLQPDRTAGAPQPLPLPARADRRSLPMRSPQDLAGAYRLRLQSSGGSVRAASAETTASVVRRQPPPWLLLVIRGRCCRGSGVARLWGGRQAASRLNLRIWLSNAREGAMRRSVLICRALEPGV